MVIVKRDLDGEAWIRIGEDRWAQAGEVIRGQRYADQWSMTTEELEVYGPFEVEWEVPS